MPLPSGSGADVDRRDAERVDADRRADDVDDRVDAADLVEVDVVGRRRRARVASASASSRKIASARLRARGGERGRLQDRADRRERALGLRLCRPHVELRRADRAVLAMLERELAVRRTAERRDTARGDPSNGNPRSRSAPTVMSPLIPENASKYACIWGGLYRGPAKAASIVLYSDFWRVVSCPFSGRTA